MDQNLVYKMKFWNFELITILPSTPSPFSVPAVTAFAVSPSATHCVVVAPRLGSPRALRFLPEASRHRHASPSICAHTEVRHRTTTTTTCRVGLLAPRSSALSPPFHFLHKQDLYLPLYSHPYYKRQAGPPTASRAAVARHERRRPRPPRGAPSSVFPRPEPPPGTSPSRLTDPPKPAHRRPNPPERRLRREQPPPTAGACGAAASDLLPANQGHP